MDKEEFVCADCIDDEGLKDFIEGEATECTCSFCGAEAEDDEPIAAPIEKVVDYINDCLYAEYDDAANCLPYDSGEGGYLGVTWNTWELLSDEVELSLPNDDDGSLFDAICSAVDDNAWCERNPFSLNNVQEAKFSWELFSRVVKHQRRFFFLDSTDEYDEVLSPKELLETILDHARKVCMLVSHESGELKVYRARHQAPGVQHTSPEALGPPPVEKAKQSNRMSPAGIVMCYASDSTETALRETALINGPGTYAIGAFTTTRATVILDLADLPSIPSLFEEVSDTLEYHPRKVLQFLHAVARELSQPVPRDGREHIDYVPTQVITEFVRSQVERIDGIRYSSAVDDDASLVLFADQSNLVPLAGATAAEQWLQLADREERQVSQADIDGWKPASFDDLNAEVTVP